jgi:hypothetical protein
MAKPPKPKEIISEPTKPVAPETRPENVNRIEREIRAALKCAGIDIPSKKMVDELSGVVVAECVELRHRIASRILGVLIDRGDGVTHEQLQKLAYIVEYHYEDGDGEILVPEP